MKLSNGVKLENNRFYTSYNFRVQCPLGEVFVFVIEDDNQPKWIDIFIGKAGSEASANAQTLAGLSSELLQQFNGFNRLMLYLCDVSTDKMRITSSKKKCRSLPEALYIALDEYRNMKTSKTTNKVELKLKRISRPAKMLPYDRTRRSNQANSLQHPR